MLSRVCPGCACPLVRGAGAGGGCQVRIRDRPFWWWAVLLAARVAAGGVSGGGCPVVPWAGGRGGGEGGQGQRRLLHW